MSLRLSILALGIATSLLSGCGTEDPGAEATPTATPAATPTPGPEDSERLLPMAIGATWTYLVIDLVSGVESSKSRTVEAYEDVGDRKAGIAGYRLRVENANGHSLSWFEDLGAGVGVVRHREQSFDGAGLLEKDEFYDAHKLRVDETDPHRVPGASWTEVYTETVVKPGEPESTEEETRNWTVESLESVTVPAGTFDALRVRRVSPAGGSDKTAWFVEGVGAVREYELGKDDVQLSAWSLPAAE